MNFPAVTRYAFQSVCLYAAQIRPVALLQRAADAGVASHIPAAHPGGPRFDVARTPAERSSIDNAIWLCQRCAKRVDDDIGRYEARVLQHWTVTAEPQNRKHSES